VVRLLVREEHVLTQAAVNPAAATLEEARSLLLRGWCTRAQARDDEGLVVPAWSDEASSWSLLGALLASWQSIDDDLDADFAAHTAEALALGDATQALGEATGTAALDVWNDAPGRNVADVITAVNDALALLEEHAYQTESRRAAS
jgi:hypothetical protein